MGKHPITIYRLNDEECSTFYYQGCGRRDTTILYYSCLQCKKVDGQVKGDKMIHIKDTSVLNGSPAPDTTLLIKVADQFASNIVAGALKELETRAKTSFLGVMSWGEPADGGGLFIPSTVAAGSGVDWAWALVGVISDNVVCRLNERYRTEFAQTTTILIKIIPKTTIDTLTAAMNFFTDGAVNKMDVDATIEWSDLFRASTAAAAAGSGDWLWSIGMSCEFVEREREGVCTLAALTADTVRQMNYRYHVQFDQTSTILLKGVERVTTEMLGRAMARLDTETTQFDVAATVEWSGALCSPVGAAADSGWLWAAVGVLLAALLGQTGYIYRGPVGRALRSVHDRLRRRPPPTRPQTTSLLIKVADQFASNVVAAALNHLETLAKTSLLGVMNWGEPAGGGGLFIPSTITAGDGVDWAWAWPKRATSKRPQSRERLRRCHAPPPPQRPRPLALSASGPPPPLQFIRFTSPDPSASQTTTILIKIIPKTTIDTLTAAMNFFTDGAVNKMDVDATIEWSDLFRASTAAAAAGSGDWLWSIAREGGRMHSDRIDRRPVRQMNHRYREEFEQTSTVLLKVAERVTTEMLGRSMARLDTETTQFDVAATVEWSGALCSAVGSAVGPTVGAAADSGWLWAAVGLLLAALLGQSGYLYRATVACASQRARDRLRRRPPPPPGPAPRLIPLPPSSLAQASDAAPYPPLPPSRADTLYSLPTIGLEEVEENSLPPSRRPRPDYSTPPLSSEPGYSGGVSQ
uniref:Uncharacterized protein n=1 Tax=Plectus sambesii TaxID=2011161 RepID=A0A914UX19_9BILA